MKIAQVQELRLTKIQQEQDMPMLYCSIYQRSDGSFEYNDINEVKLPEYETNYVAYLNDAIAACIVEVIDEQTGFIYTFMRRYCVEGDTTDVLFFDDEDETYQEQLEQATALAWDYFIKMLNA